MTAKNYTQILTEDRRLSILLILLQSMGYRANEYLLSSMLDNMAHRISADQLRSDLAWLQEQGLVEVETAHDIQVAQLTRRGQDVAQGRAVVPGIKRPSASD